MAGNCEGRGTKQARRAGPPGFVQVMFFGCAVLFFGSFAASAWLVGLPLDQNAWSYALALGGTLLAGPLTTLVVFWRPPREARASGTGVRPR